MAASYNELFGLGSHSIDADVLAHWRMQESSGTSISDRSGNSQTGTTSGSPTLAASGTKWFANAISWNGSNQDMAFASNVGNLTQASTFTLIGWIKPVVANKTGWIFCNGSLAARAWSLRQSGDGTNVKFQLGLSQSTSGGTFIDSDTTTSTDWMSLIVTNNAGAISFYRNGSGFGGSTLSSPDNRAGNVNLRFASRLGANYLDAVTAEWAIINRVLSSGDIAETYAGPEPLNTVAPTLTFGGSTWTGTVGTWDSQGNGAITYAWELRDDSDDSVVQSGTGASPSGSNPAAGSYYLWVRASNDGGFDAAEDSVSDVEVLGGGDDKEGFGTITAIGNITGSGSTARSGSGSFVAIGSLDGTGQKVSSASGTITAIGILEGTGLAPAVGEQSGFGSVTAIGTLTATGQSVRSGSGSFAAIGILEGTGEAPVVGGASGSGSVTAIGSLTGQATTVRSGSGSFGAVGQLSGMGRMVAAASGQISAIGNIVGVGSNQQGSMILQYYYYLGS
jgi:hypothetical protein